MLAVIIIMPDNLARGQLLRSTRVLIYLRRQHPEIQELECVIQKACEVVSTHSVAKLSQNKNISTVIFRLNCGTLWGKNNMDGRGHWILHSLRPKRPTYMANWFFWNHSVKSLPQSIDSCGACPQNYQNVKR